MWFLWTTGTCINNAKTIQRTQIQTCHACTGTYHFVQPFTWKRQRNIQENAVCQGLKIWFKCKQTAQNVADIYRFFLHNHAVGSKYHNDHRAVLRPRSRHHTGWPLRLRLHQTADSGLFVTYLQSQNFCTRLFQRLTFTQLWGEGRGLVRSVIKEDCPRSAGAASPMGRFCFLKAKPGERWRSAEI